MKNLIFANERGLVQWNSIDDSYEVLIASELHASQGTIESLSASTNGQRFLVGWRQRPVEGNEATLVDIGNGTITPLDFPDLTYLPRDLSISPDGSWAAYINPCSSPSTPQSTVILMSHRPRPALGGCGAGVIYTVRVETPDQPIEIGYCREERTEGSWRRCMGYLWSPDSQSILWSDAAGVWRAKVGQEPRLLAPYTIGVSPYQTASTVDLRAWSPSGQYVLVGIGHPLGWNWGIINADSGQVFEFPNWIVGSRWGPSVTWLADDRIFAVLPGDIQDETPPYGQIWSINSSKDSFVLEREFEIDVSPENYPTAPTQLGENLLGFVILNIDEENHRDRGVYFVELPNWMPQKVNALPVNVQHSGYTPSEIDKFGFRVQIHWSPQGDVVIYEDNYLETRLLVPTDHGPPVALKYYFGDWSCCYVWPK
ncbi:MAG: hypothetical protein GY792_06375 [Gammaproteobacteria bacterium]|nr:hypothetical protein [Gammaproteobacteria bacterium]